MSVSLRIKKSIVAKPTTKHWLTLVLSAFFIVCGVASITQTKSLKGFSLSTPLQAKETNRAVKKWTCPMHPHYIADDYGTCPICGMDLVKIQSLNETTDQNNPDEKPIITIAPETIQNMGVRLAKVEASKFGKNIRSFGIVKENERLQSEISARVEGWVETLKITAVGDEVKSGDVLFEMFSPELIVSQRDYLLALKQSKTAQNNITRRLLSFGVQQKALNLIAKQKTVQQNLPFFATQKGTIAELNVTPGTYVNKGMTIAKIQDYSTVWVIVNVSEKDMGFITKGTKTTVHFPNLPGKTINSKVDYIYPKINERTRTGRIRLIIDNKEGTLRPGTYADVVFNTQISERLSVPSEAVLKDQNGSYVVTSLGNGKFQSKEVKLGLVTGGRAEIKSGLELNQEIVISSQFLIDSESALRESFKKLERKQRPLNQLNLSKIDLAKFDHMVDAALYIHEALTQNFDIEKKQLEPAIAIKTILWSTYKETKLAGILMDTEAALKRAQSSKTKSELQQALSQMINALEPWLQQGKPEHYKSKELKVFKTKTSKQNWIQLSQKPANPYNKEKSDLIPWPEISKTNMEQKEKQQSPDTNKSMRGSSHDH